MQNHKKNLWLMALVGALTIAFAAGCPDDDKTTTTKGGGGGSDPDKTAQVHEWKKVTKSADFVNSDDIRGVKMSRDGKFAYFNVAGTAVRGFDADGFAISDKGKFFDVALQTSAADDTAAGGAKVTGVTVSKISPTRSGALLHVAKAGPGLETGIVYVKDKTQTAIGWVNDAATELHFNQVTAAVGDAISAYSVEGANGAEMVYICGVNGGAGGCSTEVRGTVNLKTPATGALAKDLTNNVANWTSEPILVSTGADAYVVTTFGIQKLDEANIGTTQALAQRQAGDAKYGSDLWKTDSATGAANTPAHAVFVNNKVYIGFASTGANDGGVNVFDVAGDKIAGFTDGGWKGKAVLGFAVKGNNVYAVTKKGIFAVKDDGKIGDELKTTPEAADYAAAKDAAVYDKGEAMPTDNITGAEFVGDNLIITTSDKGIFVRLAAQPRVYSK